MPVRVLRSTDTSAPVLTGQAGSLITLLDACLVTGYGTQSPLGWTKAFSGTNKAAYRNDAATGTGTYLRVQDDQAGYGRAYVTGYEAMTTVDAGTGPFPSATQIYAGWGKSNTADATARPWVVIGDQYRFYLFVQTGENSSDWASAYFGDIFSYKAADAYRALLASRYTTSGISSMAYYTDYLAFIDGPSSANYAGRANTSMPRDHAGIAGPKSCGFHTDNFKATAGSAAINSSSFYAGAPANGLAYPNGVNNGLILAPIWVHHSSPNVVRGHMPGLWAPMHSRPLANNDTFSGAGALAGKTFEAFNVYNGGQLIVETSDTWS